MTWAIGTVVLLLVGLPLAAVWWSRRAMWSRLRPGRDRDPFGDAMRRHGLGPAAMARVENAVLWGKRLDDPAERAAVVDLAKVSMPPPPGPRSTLLLVVAVVALLGGVGAWVTTGRDWGDIPWFGVVAALAFGWGTGGPRRAVRRNTD